MAARFDLNQLKAQINKSLGDASVVVKASCGLVTLLYLLTFSGPVWPALAVCPGYLIPPKLRIWTLITGGFLEYRFWNVGIDIAVLVLCGKFIEPLWGALEFLKFVLILNVGTSLLISVVCLALYMATFNLHIWFFQFSGMTGIISGMLVAFMQINPDQELQVSSVGVKIKQVPSLLVLLYLVLVLVGLLPMVQLGMVLSGLFIGWVYLRFYQPRARGVKGDLSEGFAFDNFFPKMVQGPISTLSTIVFNIMIKVGICSKPVRTYDVGAPSAITISLPGMDPADAERRRQKALKALNERLQKLEQSQSNWPTMEDQGEHDESSPSSPGPDGDVPTVVVDKGVQDITTTPKPPPNVTIT
ncbi:transmembrane protein 115 [Nematostella vectensis]|uniref:transmembrane protein 115 n=1 Tax=Nematostella vectensis TaxID=45351 RepID=UPI0020771764|nr:transmembrane protein 115 [Nematostella vectensis]